MSLIYRLLMQFYKINNRKTKKITKVKQKTQINEIEYKKNENDTKHDR